MKSIISQFLSLNDNSNLKIAVIGDSVIDEYYHVMSNRVSPEFPIPILLSSVDTPDLILPGGAANTCCQFQYFNVNCFLYSFVDENLLLSLKNSKVETKFSLNSLAVNPVKRRLYHGDFPLCRWDIEKPFYGLSEKHIRKLRNQLFRRFSASAPLDVVVFSDYGKGLFSVDQNWVAATNAITIVDPKFHPLDHWIGCTVFKPNAKEAAELSGESDWRKQCDYFHKLLSCPNIVITQGGAGVVGKSLGEYFEYRCDNSISAESVIGAGDCFVSFLAMALGHKMPVIDAVKIAWEAGSVYVQRKHNKPIAPSDILSHIDPAAAKIVTPDKLARNVRDFKLILTNGCFDVLHPGHLSLLKQAKALKGKLAVLVNDDASIKRLKGENRPVISISDRMSMLASLDCVDFVIPFSEDTPLEMIKQIEPDILAKGSDYQKQDVVGSEYATDVIILPLVDGYSTSKIIKHG